MGRRRSQCPSTRADMIKQCRLESAPLTLAVSKTFAGFYLTLHTHNLAQCVNDFHQIRLSRHHSLD